VNPVRNSSGALNRAGILLKWNLAAEQRGIIKLRKSNGTQCFLLHPPHPPLSPILGERIKVRGHELPIRRPIIYTNINISNGVNDKGGGGRRILL